MFLTEQFPSVKTFNDDNKDYVLLSKITLIFAKHFSEKKPVTIKLKSTI